MLLPSLRRLPLLVLFLLLFAVPLFADTPAAPPPDLYVSSLTAGGVLRLNGATGTFVNSFSANAASGLTFGPDGALYVASYNDTVVRIDTITG